MDNLEKEFVPYNLALRLKELGFNEPCFGFYQKEYVEDTPFMVDDDEQYRLTGYRTCKNSEIPEHYTSAPTFSQAFRWFRDKHGLYAVIDGLENRQYYKIVQLNSYSIEYDTYEEAELVCLEKLLEIVEKKEL